MRIIEIADKLIQTYDLSEITKEFYYEQVAETYNQIYAK